MLSIELIGANFSSCKKLYEYYLIKTDLEPTIYYVR